MKRLLGTTAAVAALGFGSAQANVLTFFETQFDTDFASAGVGGLRGVGAGEIELAGTSGTITRAYLYWHGPTDSTDPNAEANIMVNGVAVTGTNIGFSDDNFWSRDNSQAYRADITDLVSGDGSYTVDGFTPENVNGASLLVFYDDGDDTNNRDIVLFDGNDANFENEFDAPGWDITLNNIEYDGGPANIELHVSDGQDFGPTDDGTLTLNGAILETGGIFQGDSVPVTAGTSVANGGLWDIENYDIASFLDIGLNTINIALGSENDALSIIVAAIDLPQGAAPPDVVPVPAAALLFLTGAAGLAVSRRARRG